MNSNWWIIAQTLKARERDIATLYERYWYPRVDEALARRRAERRVASRARMGRVLGRLFAWGRARQARTAEATCDGQGLACC